MHEGVTIYFDAIPDRREVRALAKRDPRKEKLRDFRKSRRASCNPRCGMCQPHKRWRSLRRRDRVARAAV